MGRPGYDNLVSKVLYLFSAFNPFKKKTEEDIQNIKDQLPTLIDSVWINTLSEVVGDPESNKLYIEKSTQKAFFYENSEWKQVTPPYFDLVVFTPNTNIGNIATAYSFNPTTKINRATVTGNVVITLPTYPSTQSVSLMLKITQGTGGGFNITFQDEDTVAAINLSQFDFTEGTEGQRTWVTLLWDGEEWCFTASAWKDAI